MIAVIGILLVVKCFNLPGDVLATYSVHRRNFATLEKVPHTAVTKKVRSRVRYHVTDARSLSEIHMLRGDYCPGFCQRHDERYDPEIFNAKSFLIYATLQVSVIVSHY